MKTKLNSREYVTVASMLFGMFFGAGNLIFPVYMGQQAGSHVWAATIRAFSSPVWHAPAGRRGARPQPLEQPV